jgi:hypothetical protein
MTAKEKVLSVYPDAVCLWHVTEGQLCGYVIKTSALSYGEVISELSIIGTVWQSALNELIKNGLCTE